MDARQTVICGAPRHVGVSRDFYFISPNEQRGGGGVGGGAARHFFSSSFSSLLNGTNSRLCELRIDYLIEDG